MKRLFLLSATFVACAAAGAVAVVAWATPGSGIVGGPIVARGTVGEALVLGTPTVLTVTRRVRLRIAGKVYVRRVKFKVPSVRPVLSCGASKACDTAVQQLTISPQGHTGWHSHPGPTVVAVAQGEGTLYHAGESGCPGHKFAANSGFYQPPTDVHNFRNEGAGPLTVFAFYALPTGTPNTAIRTDQPQPASCPNIP